MAEWPRRGDFSRVYKPNLELLLFCSLQEVLEMRKLFDP